LRREETGRQPHQLVQAVGLARYLPNQPAPPRRFEPLPKCLRPKGMRTIPAPLPKRMELPMSIKTKIAALALAALATTGALATSTTKAEAYPVNWGWGVGAGIATAAIVGNAIAASSGPVYYTSYRRCGFAP